MAARWRWYVPPVDDGGAPTLAELTSALRTTFSADVDGRAVDLTLVDVRHADRRPGWETFSLLFATPDSALPQATYAVEHDRLGSFLLFLVPVLDDAGEQRYEAVFNRRSTTA